MPLSGLSICAVGDRVVVRDGQTHWQAETGQYLLGLEALDNGVLQLVERPKAGTNAPLEAAAAVKSAEEWFVEALELEDTDARAARRAYEQAVKIDPEHVASWINWGRLLHEAGATGEADTIYQRAIDRCGRDALLLFNRAVLLEDLGNTGAALEAYQAAIEEDPEMADCHYNLARLYEVLGKPQHAIRHLGQYRRLVT
jgi:tetratricopeptide (TPR) repeat protein